MLRALASIFVLATVVGCREKPAEPAVAPSTPVSIASAPPTPTTPASPASRMPPAPASDSPLACNADRDCTNSCRHGAVNRRWWELKYPGEEGCEDGCTSKGTDPARCENGKCTAYAFGKPAKECTELLREVVPGPGPAHRCNAPADCMNSCRYGAVNRNWYGLAQRNECKDGCAGKGSEAPRCEKGMCTAYNRGVSHPHCTERSVHAADD